MKRTRVDIFYTKHSLNEFLLENDVISVMALGDGDLLTFVVHYHLPEDKYMEEDVQL